MLKNNLNHFKKLLSPMGVAYTSLFLTFPALIFLVSYSSPASNYQEYPQYNTNLMVQLRQFLAQNYPDHTPSNEIILPGKLSVENESEANTRL